MEYLKKSGEPTLLAIEYHLVVQGNQLKGVEGCIFPPESPSILRPVTRELYFDQIAIP